MPIIVLVWFCPTLEQDALGHFRTVVAAKADLPNAWVSLGAIYINAGNHHEAVMVLTDALGRFPAATWQKLPEAYYNFGIALGLLGRTDEGIEKWTNAAGGKINIRYVDQPGDVDIECIWTSNPDQLRNRAEGGEAQVYYQGGEIRKATITILTVPLNRAGSITDNNIRSVALHEIGHVFGLLGHSPNPQDVMFFSARIRDEKPELSARDRRTLLRLYSRN